MDIQNHVRPNTPTKVKNRRRGNADAAAGDRGGQGGCARSPAKFSGHLGGHAAEHDKSTEGEREMPRPSRGSGPRAKSGIPQPRQISSVRSQHALAQRRATAITKQSRDSREGGRGAGSLPCLTCSELMKQEKLGHTSSINFHTHAHKHTITRASTDSGHIEHVF